jgi:hypothetical protein
MSNGFQPDFLESPVRADGPIRLVDPVVEEIISRAHADQKHER